MKKNLHYLIGLDRIILFLGLILMATTSTMAQNTIADTTTDASEQGIRMIDVDLSINPRYPILYSDTPDTIFVYERLSDNTLIVYDKYAYDSETKRWISTKDKKRPFVKIDWRKRKDATIVNLKAGKSVCPEGERD